MRSAAWAGTALVSIAIVVVCWLEVKYAARGSWRELISLHALRPDGWAFDVATALATAGSAAISVSLIGRRIAPVRSAAAWALTAWCAGLAVITLCTADPVGVRPTASGVLHFAGCVLAFGSLPLAALAIGRRGRHTRYGRSVMLLGAMAALWVAATVLVMLVALWQGAPLSPYAPLGIAERGLLLTEFTTLVTFGLRAAKPCTAPRHCADPAYSRIAHA